MTMTAELFCLDLIFMAAFFCGWQLTHILFKLDAIIRELRTKTNKA